MDNTGYNNIRPSVKDEFCVWSDAGKASMEYEISEEYILPDYLPDIRKILMIKAKVEENDAYIQEGKAEYSGDVVFNVVYLGDTGQVKCVSQAYPYTNYVSLESIYDDSVIDAKTMVSNRSVRAVSPRKLLLKGKVVTEISIYNKLCVSPRLIGSTGVEDEFTLERKTDYIECVNFLQFSESDIRVSEDIEYKGKAPISEVVHYDADVFMTDCKYADGRLNVKGNANVRCIVGCSEEGENASYETVEKNIPIDHSFDVRVPGANAGFYGNLELGAIECGVANDSYGESRVLEVDFVCRANITAVSNESTVFTDDVFSTAYNYENTYKKVNTERLVKSGYTNFSSDGSGEITNSESGELDRIISTQSEAEMSLRETENGKAVFEGDCKIKAVILDKNGNYITSDMAFPLRYTMPLELGENTRCMADCNVLDSSVSMDGNTLHANVEIGLNYAIFEKVSANSVAVISIDKSSPLEEKSEKAMKLYYPEKNDDLWSVAKKYNIPRSSLESANKGQLSEGLPRVLLIPTKSTN